MNAEFRSLLELLGMLLTDPRTSVLIALLVIGAARDYRTFKIPNWLTYGGATFALIYNTVVPFPFHAGFLWAFGGLWVGLLLMLPMYILRAMGAGDVKLMAMAGAFLGASDAFYAALYVFIVGGIFALGYGIAHRAFGRVLLNIKGIFGSLILAAITSTRPDMQGTVTKSVGKLPYGVSIALGTIGYVVARQLGYAS
ncbi:prepilin peptidase CpaA [Variovorax sp. HW608]|uniref:A24 family peptidase n=1 Tax=Variovorax sp. HW608 TaxID=1034889 RepID=UPI0008200C36|nr:prepilin peptidase [Variovorax sp. HW608]SCK30790.1 prepilin peptidase CpaA [Variovorax sp. HW608]